MELKLRDFENNVTTFTIDHEDHILSIIIVVLCGDETATIYYDDQTFTQLDGAGNNGRKFNLFDIAYELPLHRVDEFNNFDGSSYEHFGAFMHIDVEVEDDEEDETTEEKEEETTIFA